MNKKEVLLAAEKNDGYLSSMELKENDIPSIYFYRLVKESGNTFLSEHFLGLAYSIETIIADKF